MLHLFYHYFDFSEVGWCNSRAVLNVNHLSRRIKNLSPDLFSMECYAIPLGDGSRDFSSPGGRGRVRGILLLGESPWIHPCGLLTNIIRIVTMLVHRIPEAANPAKDGTII